MASVHIDEVRHWRSDCGDEGALPGRGDSFFEIRLDSDAFSPSEPDHQYVGQVLTVDSPQGVVTITFDENGWLSALDIS